jgi:hypothetical protein
MNIKKAGTHKSTYKGHVSFYPVIKFWFGSVNDEYFINDPQPTRAKALTIAKQSIRINPKVNSILTSL